MNTYPLTIQRPLLMVRDQIQACLQEASQTLEQYHQDQSQEQLLAHCSDLFDQVSGCLTMLELHGATSLTLEMRSLAQAIADPQRIKHDRCCEFLVSATLFLPRYLDYVSSQGHETPALLLPTINLLRFVRREGLIPEHRFIAHELPITPIQRPAEIVPADEGLMPRIRRLRHMYQMGLLGLMWNRSLVVHLRFMAHAIEQLKQLCGVQPFNEFWDLTLGILEGLQEGGLHLDNSIKHIFGAIDRQIKVLVDEGPELLANPMPAELRTHLLYYIAKTKPAGERVQALQDHYQLRGCIPDDHYLEEERRKLQAPDRAAMQTVALQLLEDLSTIKEQILAFDHPQDIPEDQTRKMTQALDQMALTLELLNLTTAMQNTRLLAREILMPGNLGTLQGGPIHHYADLLINIENTLQEFAQGTPSDQLNAGSQNEFTQGEHQALEEARAAIAKIKQSLDTYLDPYAAEHGQAKLLETATPLLKQVSGALQILQLEELAQTLHALRRYLGQMSALNHLPAPQEFEALADAFVGIEWFLEDYESHRDKGEGVLQITRKSVEILQQATKPRAVTLH